MKEERKGGRKRTKRDERMLGSDGGMSVLAAHSTVAAVLVHIRRKACVWRPTVGRSGAAGDKIGGGGGPRAVGYRNAAREVR